MLELDVLLTESAMAEEFLAAFQRRYLAEKFFYWFPLSVEAWLDLCQEAGPYKNYGRSYQLTMKHAPDIAKHLGERRVWVASLGAGQGDKDLLILKALREHGIEAAYQPVDASQALLELALRQAAEAGFPTRGVKADVADPQTFRALRPRERTPRLYLLLGNTLSVTDPADFLGTLGSLLRPQDRLLVDAEVFNPRSTLAGYDNPLNRRFAFGPLASVGLEEGRDGELVFETRNGKTPGLYFIAKYFRAARPLRLLIAGHWLDIQPGEKIEMNASCKYSPGVFPNLLRERGGFRLLREYLSDDDQFLMVLAAPRTEPAQKRRRPSKRRARNGTAPAGK